MFDITFLYFLLVLAFFVIVSVPLFQYAIRKRRDIFEPIYPLTLTFLIQYWLRSVEAVITGNAYLGTPPFPDDIIKSWNVAWIYLLLAFTLFLWGYYSKIGVAVANLFPNLNIQWSVKKSYFVVLAILLISVISFVTLFEKLGGWHTYLTEKYVALTTLGTGYLYFFISFATIAFLISYIYFKEFGRYRFIIFPIALIFLTIALTSGTRGALFAPILSLFIIRQNLKKRRNNDLKNPGNWKIILIICFVIILVFPIILAIRDIPIKEIIDNPLAIYRNLSYLYFSITGHYQSITPFIYIIRDTPSVLDFQYGKTYFSVLTQWFPRQIWKSKPPSFAMVFTDKYFNNFYSFNQTIISPTLLGEAYINFHIAGILLVALVSGIIWKAVYHYFVTRNKNSLSAIFIFSIILPFTLTHWESFFGAIYLPVATLVSGIFVSILLSKNKK